MSEGQATEDAIRDGDLKLIHWFVEEVDQHYICYEKADQLMKEYPEEGELHKSEVLEAIARVSKKLDEVERLQEALAKLQAVKEAARTLVDDLLPDWESNISPDAPGASSGIAFWATVSQESFRKLRELLGK